VKISCFNTYDVRGEINININPAICYRISRAFSDIISAKNIIVGYDARETSPEFARAVIEGARDAGVDVLEIGLSGTEEMYWATRAYNTSGGISVTASHNPINYNGMKMVKYEGRPLDPSNELKEIRILAETSKFKKHNKRGKLKNIADEARISYVSKILTFVDFNQISPIHIVVNSGNGAAGPTFNAIA
jgi:phosphomannomutase